jgi:acetolactate synthase-1/2/3 large subunit
MEISGARIVVESLIDEGVETVFGYPGGAIMNVYDELYKQNRIKHILSRHEQGAIHAAEGFARITGKVGVAIVTSGPGFTNTITGLANAYTDSIPLVVISGQVSMSLIGTDAFQEIDAVGISRACTKHNYLVTKASDLPRIIKEAFHIARTGRPGPVHIDIPKDVTAEIAKYYYPETVDIPTYRPVSKPDEVQIEKAVEAIKNSKKPLLYLGGGIVSSNSSGLVRELAKITGIPAVETLMARGVMEADNPLLISMVGMHGSYAANIAMSEADLIISLGARFDDRVTGKLSEFGKNAKIIHVDIDPSSIDKLVNVDYPVLGDLNFALSEMLPKLLDIPAEQFASWRETIQNNNKLHPLKYFKKEGILKPQEVIEKIGEMLGDQANITTDVGQHQMWAAQFYPFTRARQFNTSGSLGTMGYGFPSAIGVKVGDPERISINISGDGSILMNIQELMTAVEHQIPVINVILNNNYLGMVRQWQTLFYDNRISETDLSAQPDFIKLAESFGGIGYRVETMEEFENALKDAIEKNIVAMIDVKVCRDENVMPMVPAGASLYNMMLVEEK